MKEFLRRTLRRLQDYQAKRDDELKFQLGQLRANQFGLRKSDSLREVEFRVFSQWGEDGILQYLIRNVEICSESFVEFGVQDYRESNTRFLLMQNNWRGLIIDGGQEHIRFLRRRRLDWMYDITAVQAFITAENINDIMSQNGFAGDLGILSVDIDGMDYWVLKAIQVAKPTIVVAEYNSFFGSKRALSVPYRPDFRREKAHHSNLYWGASLQAFINLMNSRAYAFVGCNRAGNNAFFVERVKLREPVSELSREQGYVKAKFWECRAANGEIAPRRHLQSYFGEMATLPLRDTITDEDLSVGDVLPELFD